MAYTPRPGQGTLNKNKFAEKNDKAPGHKGYWIAPDGRVMGYALFKIPTQNGYLLSLKPDDREGEYWAKQLNRPQWRVEAELKGDDGDQRHERREEPRRESGSRHTTESRGDRQGRGSRHDAPAQGSRHSQASSRHSDDLDDDCPF